MTNRYIKIPYSLFTSDAYKMLRPSSRDIFLILKSLYNGKNNGKIFLSCRQAKDLGYKIAKGTASKALEELYNHGFIKLAFKGNFSNQKASEWILTCEEYQGKPPTNDWKNFDKDKKQVPNIEPYGTVK